MYESLQRILVFSDEVSLTANHVKDTFKGYEYQVFDSTDVTNDLAAMNQVHGLSMDVAPDEHIASTITSRYRLGLHYDLISLYSLRVLKLPDHLERMHGKIRECTGESEDGIRLSGLPVAVMNPLNMINLKDRPQSEKFQSLLGQRELYASMTTENFPELAARAIGTWWLNAVCDLRYQGVGLTIDENGRFSVCGAYSHPLDDSFYFAGGSRATPLVRKAWRVSGAADELSESIQSLQMALQQASTVAPKEQEPILHACFKQYPELLAMGIYDSVLSEVSFKSPDPFGLSIRPDFIAMNSIIPGLKEASAVIEIKSPEMRLRTSQKASRQFRKALDQLGNLYKNYFDDPRTMAEQVKQIGRPLTGPKLMLIIGRNAWQDEWLDLRQDHGSSEFKDMRIVSYDDVHDLAQMRQSTLSNVSQAFRGDG